MNAARAQLAPGVSALTAARKKRAPKSVNATVRLQVLAAADCEDWVLRAMLLKRHWQRRHPQVPFFTLGLAAYLDCAPVHGTQPYHDLALRQHSNALLLEHFGALLAQVRATLQSAFAFPVQLAPDAAVPGLHIYLPHPAFALPVAKVHQDLQTVMFFRLFHRAPKMYSRSPSRSAPRRAVACKSGTVKATLQLMPTPPLFTPITTAS
jgi:hypothetical protein